MSTTTNPSGLQIDRRHALQIGAGLFGLNLPQFLRAANAAGGVNRDVSCIFIFLAGGASHFETFDPKPDAPPEIRGLWNPTRTNVPGTHICEKMPLMAQRMDKVSIVRSWRGKTGSHLTGVATRDQRIFPAAFRTTLSKLRLCRFGSRRKSSPRSAVSLRFACRGSIHDAVRLPGHGVRRLRREGRSLFAQS